MKKKNSQENYKLVVIRPCGRSGSLFLHSLFDNHPQTLSFPVILPFYFTWQEFNSYIRHFTLDGLINYYLNRTHLKYLFTKPLASYEIIDKNGRKTHHKINKTIFISNIKKELGHSAF